MTNLNILRIEQALHSQAARAVIASTRQIGSMSEADSRILSMHIERGSKLGDQISATYPYIMAIERISAQKDTIAAEERFVNIAMGDMRTLHTMKTSVMKNRRKMDKALNLFLSDCDAGEEMLHTADEVISATISSYEDVFLTERQRDVCDNIATSIMGPKLGNAIAEAVSSGQGIHYDMPLCLPNVPHDILEHPHGKRNIVRQ